MMWVIRANGVVGGVLVLTLVNGGEKLPVIAVYQW